MNFLELFPTVDLFILFLFAGVVVLHLVFIKKEKLLVDLIALYTSFVLLIVLPIFSTQVSEWLTIHPLVRVGGFVGLATLLYIALSFSNIASFSKKISPTEFATSLIYRIGLMGLFFTTVIYFLPTSVKAYFGTLTNFLFGNLIAMLFWFVLPIFFAFGYKFKTRRGWIE